MRVLLISPHFIQYAIELANGLAACGAEVGLVFNHDNAVDLVGAGYRDKVDPKVQLLSMPGKQTRKPWTRSFLRNLFWYRKTLRRFRPEVVHFQASNDLATLCTLLFRRLPLVVTIHDVTPHPGEADKHGNRWFMKFARDRLYPRALKRGVRFIVHGESLRQFLNDEFQVPLDAIASIPHGILATFDDAEVVKAPLQPRPAEAPGSVLFFGRMEHYKGLHVLLEALPLVLARLPETRFVIAGRGESLDKLRAEFASYPQVEIRDYYIQSAEVAELFRDAAVTVAPYIEASQSGVIASAYAFDVPAIASKVGALHEVVLHEKTGLLVEPDDAQELAAALSRFLEDHELRERLRHGVRELAEGPLSWPDIARRSLEWYAAGGR